MTPAPGERLVRHVGDVIEFSVTAHPPPDPARGWRARLRTTLGRGRILHADIARAHTARVPPFGASWHDIPLDWNGTAWSIAIPLAEVGYFAAKAYLTDPSGAQHWPEGPDFGLSVHPEWCRSANIIYAAFPRLFGETRSAAVLLPEPHEPQIEALERDGFAVLPRSGTFRDLRAALPHIFHTLGCRILHLLPVHPTPTTFARFGRLGSPYAALDLTAVDPALVEFDHRTTGIDQFVELTRAVHDFGGRVFLDIVLNHTGWGSRLFEEHPEFFRREPDGRFASPGAWGVVWEDLVELEQRHVALWDLLAHALLTWCRRGVDGFRCDAGYKIPVHVWQYLIARVRTDFPDTVFLLEGLGGPWDATEQLLTHGGMQWAYSELFQNHSPHEVQSYLDYALPQSERLGTYVHYSETHDNNRLGARGRAWSILRNRLCALTSTRGAFGYTCGVEWLAPEKIRVHQRTGLAWDNPDNIIPELAALARLLSDHPAFFDGARLRRLSPPASPVYALERVSAAGDTRVLVLVNTSLERTESITLPAEFAWLTRQPCELLGQQPPSAARVGDPVRVELGPAAAVCLSADPLPPRGFGEIRRRRSACVAWALQQATVLFPQERLLPPTSPDALADAVAVNPLQWLATLSDARAGELQSPAPLPRIAVDDLLARFTAGDAFPNVVLWEPRHASRVTPVPPGWWLLVRGSRGFRATLRVEGHARAHHAHSVGMNGAFVAAFPPREPGFSQPATLVVEPFSVSEHPVHARLQYLSDFPVPPPVIDPEGVALLTNARGAMARLRVDFGTVRSKYDAALAANLHPSVPVDRHVFVKRVRAWINADGFLSALDRHNLIEFAAGPPARWTFCANAGDSRCVVLSVEASMVRDRNTTILRFSRAPGAAGLRATLTLRVDIEDRSFHAETHRNPGAEHHFSAHSRPMAETPGFIFSPAADRTLRVFTDRGAFHPHPEWSTGIPHPIEASRGQVAHGDAYSPGWFQIDIAPGEDAVLCLDAEPTAVAVGDLQPLAQRAGSNARGIPPDDPIRQRLAIAAEAFVVRRDDGATIIAGYPWFLDWGRDTLIAARGLLAAGWHPQVLAMLDVFARFADRGTLPNTLFGDHAGNRDTTDAPLWFLVTLEESAALLGAGILADRVRPGGPSRLEVARGLVEGYLAGTPNGIRVDPDSALVWSPSHFTWMDTNHPAGTPREGYPVEIQALWIRALRFLARTDASGAPRWSGLAEQATRSLEERFWLEENGWYADVLHARPGVPAARAVTDTSLRCNMLLVAALGLARPERARRLCMAAFDHLLVPGAVRTLAPLPVSPPLPIHAPDGRLLNRPDFPYQGRYEGDEDTRRKPAYHNGTAWVFFLPVFCEALLAGWPDNDAARRSARAILGSIDTLLSHGCVGHLPEILDGDAPHTQRGCDAQAWSVTEVLRVWRALQSDPR